MDVLWLATRASFPTRQGETGGVSANELLPARPAGLVKVEM